VWLVCGRGPGEEADVPAAEARSNLAAAAVAATPVVTVRTVVCMTVCAKKSLKFLRL
jgi:hypothetical protein